MSRPDQRRLLMSLGTPRPPPAGAVLGPILKTPDDTSPVQPKPDLTYLLCRYCSPTYEPHTTALHQLELERAHERAQMLAYRRVQG